MHSKFDYWADPIVHPFLLQCSLHPVVDVIKLFKDCSFLKQITLLIDSFA